MICRRWGQRGEGSRRRWSATELGVKQGLELEERKERRIAAAVSLVGVACGFPGNPYLLLIPLLQKLPYEKHRKHQF